MNGMPHGAPWYTVPKSGCRLTDPPQRAIRLSELGSTASAEMSRFHGLSAGNTARGGSGGGGGGGGGGGDVGVMPRQPRPSAKMRVARQRLMRQNSGGKLRSDVVPVTRRVRPCPTSATAGIL